ncbi:MAG: hypothetical protein IH594_13820 [Bacteroidales bacterium]|nr:hypothetical protein [Bacteroidales bacterium]
MNVHTACKENYCEVVISGAFDFFTTEEKVVEILNQIVRHNYEAVIINFRQIDGVLYKTQEQLICMTASIFIHRHYTLQGKILVLAVVASEHKHGTINRVLKNLVDLGVMWCVTGTSEEAQKWLSSFLSINKLPSSDDAVLH